MNWTHFDALGNAIMVDVGNKVETQREAIAKGRIKVNHAVFKSIQQGTVEKGDVLGVARVAGIMGLKKTSGLIPMCHPLLIVKSAIDFKLIEQTLDIEVICTVKSVGKTGVEMEALTGTTIALLTIYDMCKAIDKTMEIGQVHLYKKTGGKSGIFINDLKVSVEEDEENEKYDE